MGMESQEIRTQIAAGAESRAMPDGLPCLTIGICEQWHVRAHAT